MPTPLVSATFGAASYKTWVMAKQDRSGCSSVLRHGSLKLIEMAAGAGSAWVLGSPGHTAELDWEYPTVRSPKLADGLSSPISPTKELLFLRTMLVRLLYLIIS